MSVQACSRKLWIASKWPAEARHYKYTQDMSGYKQCICKVYPGRTILSLLSQPAPAWDATSTGPCRCWEGGRWKDHLTQTAGLECGPAWPSDWLSHHTTSCQPVSHLSLQLFPSGCLSLPLSHSLSQSLIQLCLFIITSDWVSTPNFFRSCLPSASQILITISFIMYLFYFLTLHTN